MGDRPDSGREHVGWDLNFGLLLTLASNKWEEFVQKRKQERRLQP